jgi:DNA-binding SARP family transcriptional activator
MRFGVLGPVVVDDGGGPVGIAAAKQREVLAVLALRPNQVVATEVLTEVLWPQAKPANAKQAVLNYVARLRRGLGAAADRVQTGVGGYRLAVHEDAELDYLHATALDAAAREAVEAGDWYEGQHLAETALGLWRGTPLEDVHCDCLRSEWLPVFDALRRRLEETRADALLTGSRYEQALVCLAGPVATWPLHEPLHERLLVAHYCAGRRADALSVYRTLRSALRDGLGADPSERMQRLHSLVLRDATAGEVLQTWRGSGAGPARAETKDPDSTASRRAEPAPTAASVPSQLPRRPRLLVGRDHELAALTRLLADRGHDGRDDQSDPAFAPGRHVTVLTGPAGVGKTTLALAWAHSVANRFPDGRFYLDLNGFAPDAAPMSGDDSVSILLDFLGIPACELPATPEGRLAHYRAATADKRLLFVFDNARDAAQARPLLPTGDSCRTLVTSRRSLSGLVALDGAEQITLTPLAAGDSRSLLARRLGARRVTGQEPAVEAIAEHCAHLPLALSVAAARAAAMTATPLTALADQLRTGALDTLSAGDPASTVRNVLSWSYLGLPGEAARVFRFLGLHPGPEITPAAAAALADMPLTEAAPLLGELAAMNLLSEREPGRYTMHSLLRAFAAEQFAGEATPDIQRAALHRLYDYYLQWAIKAEHSFVTLPTSVKADGLQLPAGLEPTPFADYRDGLVWFDTERTVLMALVAHAAPAGLDDYACRLAAAHSCGLMVRNRFHEAAKQGRIALAAAKGLGDPRFQASAYFQIGRALRFTGDADTARFQLERALRIQRSLDDDAGLAETHRTLAVVLRDLGSSDRAEEHALEYLAAAHRLDHQPSICMARQVLGWHRYDQGRIEEALTLVTEALALARGLGLRRQAADMLDELGTIYRSLGALEDSHNSYLRAAEQFAEYTVDQCDGLLALADAHASAGQTDRAREIWERAAGLAQGRPYVLARIEQCLAALPAS